MDDNTKDNSFSFGDSISTDTIEENNDDDMITSPWKIPVTVVCIILLIVISVVIGLYHGSNVIDDKIDITKKKRTYKLHEVLVTEQPPKPIGTVNVLTPITPPLVSRPTAGKSLIIPIAEPRISDHVDSMMKQLNSKVNTHDKGIHNSFEYPSTKDSPSRITQPDTTWPNEFHSKSLAQRLLENEEKYSS